MLIYYPSKDSCFGHASLPRSLPRFVPHLLKFIREFTINSGASSIALEVYAATQFDTHDQSSACIKKATAFFGSPPDVGDLFLGALGGKASQMNVKWTVPSHDFDKAVEFMVEGHPWPKQVLGPVTLSFSYDFIWRDPRSGGPFPGQESDCPRDNSLASHIRVDLQRNSFVAPDLKFPYELADARLHEMLSLVVPALPFRPSVKHFRKSIPLKGGVGTKIRRLEQSELDRISELVR
jgi:hypothetical protein